MDRDLSERSSIGARITELAASANHANANGSAAMIATIQMVRVRMGPWSQRRRRTTFAHGRLRF